jgi:hypothetical protein
MATKNEVAIYKQAKKLVDVALTTVPASVEGKLLGAIALLTLWEFKRTFQVFTEGDPEGTTTS